MTISSAVSRNDYVGNDAVSQYTYNFRIFADTDLEVYVQGPSDASPTLLTKGTHYTVNDVGNPSGTIDLVNGSFSWLTSGKLKTGWLLTIRRVRPLTQSSDITNQGPFYPELHEDAFDHAVMIAQQQQDEIDRSLKLPEIEAGTDAKTRLPFDRAGKILGFDASKNPVALSTVPTSGVTATPYSETLLDDADASSWLTTLGFTAYAKTLVDDATAAAARATLVTKATVSPSQITADQNNYAGVDVDGDQILGRLTSDAARSITGILAGADGEHLILVNIGSNDINLVHESGSSTAANRLSLLGSANLTLEAGDTVELVYDGTSARWRQVS